MFLCCIALRILAAQPPISGRAGLIYYAEGDIELNSRLLLQFIPMVRVAAGQTLRVNRGRAELLLQPQNFLRLADHSTVEMKSDALSIVELILGGAAILDISNADARNSISASCSGPVAQVLRPGIYRFDCRHGETPDSLTVVRGRARIASNGRTVELTSNQLILLIPGLNVRNLHGRNSDAFDHWSASRTALIARKRGQETILEDKNKPPPAGVIILPDNRGIPPN